TTVIGMAPPGVIGPARPGPHKLPRRKVLFTSGSVNHTRTGPFPSWKWPCSTVLTVVLLELGRVPAGRSGAGNPSSGRVLSTLQHLREGCDRRPLHPWQEVAVGVQGDLNGGVP